MPIFRKKKKLFEENKTQKFKKSAIYEGDLKEHWPFSWKRSRMDGKEPLQEHISVWENLWYNTYFNIISFYSIITAIQISVRKTTFYDKSSFLKIIGDAFRTDYVCSLSSHFTYWQSKTKIYSLSLDLIIYVT